VTRGGRPDRPQVCIGLGMTKEGFPPVTDPLANLASARLSLLDSTGKDGHSQRLPQPKTAKIMRCSWDEVESRPEGEKRPAADLFAFFVVSCPI